MITFSYFENVLHWKTSCLGDTGYVTYGKNRSTLMPNNTVTMDTSVSGLCWISFTELSSGILQDQCVYFWSGFLHHFMAPSTGYQLCEPPTEPQRLLTGNRRKGKRWGRVKESLISF